MHLVIGIADRAIGNVIECPDWASALDTAVKLCQEQCDEPEYAIRNELEQDNDFWYGTADDGFAVYIVMPDQIERKEI